MEPGTIKPAHECVRNLTLSEACERLLCRVGLGLGNWGEGELAALERATGLCRDEALQLVFVLIFSSFELSLTMTNLPMEEMEPLRDPCNEVAGDGGGVVKL